MAQRPIVTFRQNTAEENERILLDSRDTIRLENRSDEELTRLFAKINSRGGNRTSKDVETFTSALQRHNAEAMYGPVPGFPKGSWWGIRLDCSRDGIHRPIIDAMESSSYGATSVCTGDKREDADVGDMLTFTGGDYDPRRSQDDPLLLNYKYRVPLRLVRGYSLSNEHAPKTGYRYDGLYSVARHWIGISSNGKCHKYLLQRVPSDSPVRPRRRVETKRKNRKSVILTRQVFKKACEKQSASTLSRSPGTRYIQNTNISIRTDLYDSGLQSNKKSAPIYISRVRNVAVPAKQPREDAAHRGDERVTLDSLTPDKVLELVVKRHPMSKILIDCVIGSSTEESLLQAYDTLSMHYDEANADEEVEEIRRTQRRNLRRPCRTKTADAATQCHLESRVKMEVIDLDDVKSESDPRPESGSAFVPVESDCHGRIARLRSIGFRPITSGDVFVSRVTRRDVHEEYAKYASQETQSVGYMDEELRFEDIENEDSRAVETRRRKDDEPWHGWKRVVNDTGAVHWVGW